MTILRSVNAESAKSITILNEAIDAYTRIAAFAFEKLRQRCESPIEEILLAQFMAQKMHQAPWSDLQFYDRPFVFGEAHAWPGHSVDVWLQAVIGDYRADFLLDALDQKGARSIIVIECDGHDFHERTKEQARRDKSRDRFMVGLGIKVLRFTGSEIYRDSEAVWNEIEKHLPNGDSFAPMVGK